MLIYKDPKINDSTFTFGHNYIAACKLLGILFKIIF